MWCLSGNELNRFGELPVGALILSSKGKRDSCYSISWDGAVDGILFL